MGSVQFGMPQSRVTENRLTFAAVQDILVALLPYPIESPDGDNIESAQYLFGNSVLEPERQL